MIIAAFTEDHRRIDGLLKSTGAVLNEGIEAVRAQGPALVERIGDAVASLRRHIEWEEELLFPAVERAMPDLSEGPGHVMREEHREILRYLARLEDWIGSGEPSADGLSAARSALASMEALLADHNEKEEMIYYPLADDLLSPEDARRILDAMGADA